MVDGENIEGYLESLKSISNVVRDLFSLVKVGEARVKIDEVNSKVLEAQQYAISAYSHQQALSKRVGDLEKELVDLKDFRREKQNYELQALGNTAFSYVYKPPMDPTEPVHWLCSTCCDQDRKSILQFQNRDILNSRLSVWKCHVCGSEIRVPFTSHP